MAKRYKIIDGIKVCVAKNRRGFRARVWFHRYGRADMVPCCYCKKNVNFKESTLEHLVEIKSGGRDTLDNCDIACWDCNQRRNGSVPGVRRDFVSFQGMGLPYNRLINLGELLDKGKVNDQGTDIMKLSPSDTVMVFT